jgi:glycosyltransferase involved in cell wall biosynthesis
MVKIAYIVSRFPKLSETFVFREVNELRKQGADVHCFSIHRPRQEPLPPDAQHFLAETTYLWPPQPARFIYGILQCAVRRPQKFFDTLKLFLKQAPQNPSGIKRFLLHFLEGAYLAYLCKQRGIEFIQAHFANGPSSVAMAASALSGIPFGFTCHAQDIYADPLMLELKIAAAKLPLTISEYNRDYIANTFAVENLAKLKIHRVSVDLNYFHPRRAATIQNDSPVIVSVGRLVPKKGFVHLIRACELLARRGIAFRCLIVGGGPEQEALQAAITAGKLEEKVLLLGPQPNVRQYLQHADLFVQPCVLDASGDRDGIPTTLMEAMAMQLPVISTNVSGIPELVQHEQTGLLVPPANPEALAHAICRLLVDEKLRQELASEGRRHIEIYHDVEANTQKLLQNIRQHVSGNANSRHGDDKDLFNTVSLAEWLPKLRSKIFAEDAHLQFA